MSKPDPMPFDPAPIVLRIWRCGFMQWAAELWTPAGPTDPPAPDHRISPAGARPPDVDGYRRRDLEIRVTRWGARRAAWRMHERHEDAPAPPPLVEYLITP